MKKVKSIKAMISQFSCIILVAGFCLCCALNCASEELSDMQTEEAVLESADNVTAENDLFTSIEYGFIDFTQFSRYWSDGIFRCGTDFNVGDYYVLPQYRRVAMYNVSSTPSDWSNDGYRCLGKLSVQDGQFVNIEDGAIMVHAEEVDTDNWEKYGVYLVGEDIPAGMYKMETITSMYDSDKKSVIGISGSYQICNNNIEDTPLESKTLSESQKYIVLEDGQYIMIVNIKLTYIDI